MIEEYIGQNEYFGVEIAQNQPHKTTPHVILIPRSLDAAWTSTENELVAREFASMAAARKAANRYLDAS